MIIQYGNFAYFIYPIFVVAFTVGVYFLLRRRTERTKKLVLLAMMLVNILQHFLKKFIYPQYWGTAFDWRTFTAWLRRTKEKLRKKKADDTQE